MLFLELLYRGLLVVDLEGELLDFPGLFADLLVEHIQSLLVLLVVDRVLLQLLKQGVLVLVELVELCLVGHHDLLELALYFEQLSGLGGLLLFQPVADLVVVGHLHLQVRDVLLPLLQLLPAETVLLFLGLQLYLVFFVGHCCLLREGL